MQAMLDEMVKGKNMTEIWGAGCTFPENTPQQRSQTNASLPTGVAADKENARIFEGIAPTRVRCQCATIGPSFHPCERCLKPSLCTALRQPPPEISSQRFCARCYQPACQLLKEKRKKVASSLLLERVRVGVHDDLRKIYGPRYLVHREQIESRVTDIWDELQSQALEEEGIIYAWKDSYAAAICGDSAQGEQENLFPLSSMLIRYQRISAVCEKCGSVRSSALLQPAQMVFSRSPWMRIKTSVTTFPATSASPARPSISSWIGTHLFACL